MGVLYLDELKNYRIAPSGLSSPANIVLSAKKGDDYVEVLNENYYSDFDGYISLDYSRIIGNLVPRPLPKIVSVVDTGTFLNVVPAGYIDMKISSGKKVLKEFTANDFESESLIQITDIDYLAIPRDALISIAIPANFVSHEVQVRTREGAALAGFSRTDLPADGKGYYQYMFGLGSLPKPDYQYLSIYVKAGKPDGGIASLWSGTYQVIPGNFQQFIFGGRLGGYVSFPMAGSLEYSPNFDIQTCCLSNSIAKARVSKSAVMRQRSGGLTRKAAVVLSELLLSDDIYHYNGGVWKKIIITGASLSANTVDSLNHCSFDFLYAEDLPAGSMFV